MIVFSHYGTTNSSLTPAVVSANHCSRLSSDVTFTSSCCRPLVLTLPEATPRLCVRDDDVAHCGVGRLAPLPAA